MANALPISRLINVQLNRGSTAAQAQNTNALLVLGTSTVIDTVQRLRSYAALAGVATDFGTTAPEYLAAAAWFGQSPQPQSILIGRWAKTAAAGQLVGATISAANQLISVWTAITNGSLKIAVDGGSLQTISGLNLSSVTNLNGVASAINAVLTGATVAWNAAYSQFVVTSNTTGAASAVSFATAAGSGTDISALLGLTSASSGAYVVPGLAAETAVAAATLFDASFGQQFYGLFIAGAVDADHLAVAAYIEGSGNKHVYGVNTQAAGVLSSVSTTDIAYLLSQSGFKKTIVQYSSTSAYAVCSLLGRQLTVDYTGNKTVITLMYKTEPGITAETLNPTQIAALEAKNCNVFVNYDNNTAIIEPAKCSSGDWIDFIIGGDVLAITAQTAVFNALYTTSTKISQTDAGIHKLVTVLEGVCAQFVRDGFLAPGNWNTNGFGTLKYGDYLAKGFYVYATPVAQQSDASRATRVTPPIQIAAKCAGAVHTANLIINFNQ